MRPSRRVVLAAGLAALADAALAAEAAKRPGRFKLGPLYLTPRLELRNAGVETNVFQTRVGPVPDNSAVLRPSLEGIVPVGRRLRLSGTGYLDFNYFRQHASERSVDFAGEGRVNLTLGSLTLFGGGRGGQTKGRFSIDLDPRVLHQDKSASGGLTLNLTERISATVSGESRVFRFESLKLGDDDIKDLLGRNSLTATAQARYALTRKTTFVLWADAIRDRFLIQVGSAPREARSYRYLGGFELGERALVRGTVLAGLREFPGGVSSSAPSYRGSVLSVNVGVPFLGGGRLLGIAERDVYYASQAARTREERLRSTYVLSRFRGELLLDLPAAILGRGFAEYQSGRSVLPFLQGDAVIPRVDHYWTFGGSLLRRFGEGVRIGGTFAWSRRVSTIALSSFKGLTYGVQAEVAP